MNIIYGAPKAVTYGNLSTLYPTALVLHTTETKSWPGYKFGMVAPHYTYHPAADQWRWHGAGFDQRVGTMKSSLTTGVPANEKAVQVEIVAYSSALQARLSGGLWVGDFTDAMYGQLAEFAYQLRHRINISHVTPPPPGGWTSSQVFRLTRNAWLNFDGITAHGAVSAQQHWDTGVLDLVRISTEAQALAPPPPPPPQPSEDDDAMYEDKLTDQEWVQALRPADIDAMFAAGIHTGSPSYWINLLVDPADPAWVGFRRTTLVRRPYYHQ